MWLGPAPTRPYNPNRGLYHFRWFWDYSGGQMTNLGAHSLDIVDWCLGPASGRRRSSSVGGRFAPGGQRRDARHAGRALRVPTAGRPPGRIREARRGEPAGVRRWSSAARRAASAITRSGFARRRRPERAAGERRPAVRRRPPRRRARQPVPADGPPKLADRGDRGRHRATRATSSAATPATSSTASSRGKQPSPTWRAATASRRPATWRTSRCGWAGSCAGTRRRRRSSATPRRPRMLERPYRAPWDAELKALGVGDADGR